MQSEDYFSNKPTLIIQNENFVQLGSLFKKEAAF